MMIRRYARGLCHLEGWGQPCREEGLQNEPCALLRVPWLVRHAVQGSGEVHNGIIPAGTCISHPPILLACGAREHICCRERYLRAITEVTVVSPFSISVSPNGSHHPASEEGHDGLVEGLAINPFV